MLSITYRHLFIETSFYILIITGQSSHAITLKTSKTAGILLFDIL